MSGHDCIMNITLCFLIKCFLAVFVIIVKCVFVCFYFESCFRTKILVFQDLCLLINAEAPYWLIGIQEMTRTLGLELLESVLSSYPSVFIKVGKLYTFFC